MLAKYPKELRFKWYNFVEVKGYTVKEVCKLFGIRRKIYYYWYPKDHGDKPPSYCPKRPHPNTKLTDSVKKFIEQEKLKTNYGPLKMKLSVKRSLCLEVSPTIIYRYYQKKKLIRRPQKRLPWYQPMKEKLIINQPGQGVQADIKYVYENGLRKYQFSFADPYTLKHYFKVFSTKHSKNAIIAHQIAEKYFGFKIISVQTDNGSEFRGEYHKWLTRRNLTHYFIPKKSPWWNAQVERLHRTIDDEYYQNPYRIWKTAYEWLDYYNFKRIHLSRKGLTPQEKLEEYKVNYLQKATPNVLECVTI
ncbi:MAG: DDE-type integrase/transposase/recombinase [Patescibacteria group bacterium]